MKSNTNVKELASMLTNEQKILTVKIFYLSAALLLAFVIPVFCYAFFTGSVIMASLASRDFLLADKMLSAMWYLIAAFFSVTVLTMLCIRLRYPFYNEKVYQFIKRNTPKMSIGDASMSFGLTRRGRKIFRLKLWVKSISFVILIALYCMIFFNSAKLNILSPSFDTALRLNAILMLIFVAAAESVIVFFVCIKMKYPLFFGKDYLCIE